MHAYYATIQVSEWGYATSLPQIENSPYGRMIAATTHLRLNPSFATRLARGVRGAIGLALFFVAAFSAGMAPAQTEFSLFPNTRLVDLEIGSKLSSRMGRHARQEQTLASGETLRLDPLYSADFQEISVTWITQVEENLGIYWGLRTGESGQQYRIDPALKLGFILTRPITRNSEISLSASTVLGGRLREYPCAATTGSGGIQSVNCRLAGSDMAPEDTLNYMYNEPPPDRTRITLRYTFSF